MTVTVIATGSGTRADLSLRVPDAMPADALVTALCEAVAADPGQPVTVDGRSIAAASTAADCHLVDGAIVRVGNPAAQELAAVPELVVTCGPDAGRRLLLTDGEHVVGREPGCSLAVHDAAISRRHLLVRVGSGGTTVSDLGSANGTSLGGHPLDAGVATSLPFDRELHLGDSRLRLEPPAPASASTPRPDGGLAVHRAPRMEPAVGVVAIGFPPAPEPPPPPRVPVLAAIAPLVAGIVLALVLRQWEFLAFTALSPVMILAQAAGDRRSARQSARRAARDHEQATTLADEQLSAALAAEHRRRHAAAPGVGELIAAARGRDRTLWSRVAADRDALVLRLGRGDAPSEVRVTGRPSVTATDIPITVAVREVGVLGICGPRERRSALLRSLVLQAATLHGPSQLRLVLLAPGRADDWAWARWLPHVAARGERCTALLGFDAEQVAPMIGALTKQHDRDRAGRVPTLVVVDSAGPAADQAELVRLTELAGPDLFVVWSAADERLLPARTAAIATFAATPQPRLDLQRAGDHRPINVIPDLVGVDIAEIAARDLAPLRDDDDPHTAHLPTLVPWSAASGIDLHDHESAVQAITRRWAHGPSTSVVLGGTASGHLAVDLGRDGPHALLAGTTGAGKSELLLGLVAGLVADNRPDQLALLLVDHKGGATFGPCGALPHTVGVITDLDAATTRRALMSLSAELRRRESLFAAAGAIDFASYSTVPNTAETTAMPRLVIVVDEFATLAEDQPDFVGGLVGIAQRGRSLGVHLVLATQRPEGVVSADIRANTRLRICLAVARDNDSRDVIDSPAAAAISPGAPGRGFVRIGPGELREFQAARVGGPCARSPELRVEQSPVAALGNPPAPPTDVTGERTELDALIAAVLEASERIDVRGGPAPWLPPLPDAIALSSLPGDALDRKVPCGMVDLPADGVQVALTLDLSTGGTTLVAGGARSGRTTAIRTIVMSAAARHCPDDLQIWAIDSAGDLADLADVPHCGGVIPAHDVDRVERLVGHLAEQVAHRRHDRFADRPILLLALDSWDGLAAATDHRDGGRLADALLRLAVDGPAAGLHLLTTSDRGGLTGRLAGAVSDKFVLRLADSSDFALVGVPLRDLPRDLPPGRGIRVSDLATVQFARADEPVAAVAGRWRSPQRPVRRFDPLPRRVPMSAVIASGRDAVALGLRAEDLSPLHLTRREIGSSFVIAGPAGSGRTTALTLLAHQLTGRRLAVSCRDESPLLLSGDAIRLPADDQDHAAALLESLCTGDGPPPDVLIDDADLLPEGPLWDRLERLVRTPARPDQIVALAGSIEAMALAYRGPIAQARRAKAGLLLGAVTPQDGELLGLRLPRRLSADAPPGRGWLASRGSATHVQLADPAAETALVN